MTPEELSTTIVHSLTSLVEDGGLTLPDGVPPTVVVERPKNREHGDYATNVALRLAKAAGRPPREVADVVATGTTKPVAAPDVPPLVQRHRVESCRLESRHHRICSTLRRGSPGDQSSGRRPAGTMTAPGIARVLSCAGQQRHDQGEEKPGAGATWSTNEDLQHYHLRQGSPTSALSSCPQPIRGGKVARRP